jgi:superfamily II DNA helicase RecQ
LKILKGHDVIVVAGAGKSLIFAMVAIAAALARFKGVVIVICPLKALQLDQVCGNLWKPDKNLPIDTRSDDSMKFANQQMRMTHKCPESVLSPSTKTIMTVTHSKKWMPTKLAFAMQHQSACFETPPSRSTSEMRHSENTSL